MQEEVLPMPDEVMFNILFVAIIMKMDCDV